jgi:transposase-like protein
MKVPDIKLASGAVRGSNPRVPPIDWEKIEIEYRAGQMSVREIARLCGVSEAAVRKKAKALGWERSPADEAPAAARERTVRSDGAQPLRARQNWAAIEREYRLGRFSVREIAKRHGVGHQSILRHAVKGGWTQDKSEEVRRRVGARLLLSGPDQQRTRTGPEVEPTEADIEAVVDEKVSIHVAHISMGRDFRAILLGLANELRETTVAIGEIQNDIIEATAGDTDGSRRARWMRSVSLPSRITSAASIIASAKSIQWIERLANNLAPALPQDEGASNQGPFMIVQFEGAPEETPEGGHAA